MRVQRAFWRRWNVPNGSPAEVDYYASSQGIVGFGSTPALAVKSLRHAYRRHHSSAPCCWQEPRRA